jgi:hypothetical protein
MNEGQEWTWSDGWILMAVYLAANDQAAGLHKILIMADCINHAIPTKYEMSQSLTKFLQHSVVKQVDAKYTIASEYLPAIKMAYEGRGGLFSSADKGVKWLRNANLVASNQESIHLTDSDMNMS